MLFKICACRSVGREVFNGKSIYTFFLNKKGNFWIKPPKFLKDSKGSLNKFLIPYILVKLKIS